MFVYEKKLQYPVKIEKTDPKLASIIISQYGGAYFNRVLSHQSSCKKERQGIAALFTLVHIRFE